MKDELWIEGKDEREGQGIGKEGKGNGGRRERELLGLGM